MQMSIVRFKVLHKYIWNYVIEHYDGNKYPSNQVGYLKREAILGALQAKMLNDAEVGVLLANNSCMLCAAVRTCASCPLETCSSVNSLFSRAIDGDMKAMFEIRDIVDSGFYDCYYDTIELGV